MIGKRSSNYQCGNTIIYLFGRGIMAENVQESPCSMGKNGCPMDWECFSSFEYQPQEMLEGYHQQYFLIEFLFSSHVDVPQTHWSRPDDTCCFPWKPVMAMVRRYASSFTVCRFKKKAVFCCWHWRTWSGAFFTPQTCRNCASTQPRKLMKKTLQLARLHQKEVQQIVSTSHFISWYLDTLSGLLVLHLQLPHEQKSWILADRVDYPSDYPQDYPCIHLNVS